MLVDDRIRGDAISKWISVWLSEDFGAFGIMIITRSWFVAYCSNQLRLICSPLQVGVNYEIGLMDKGTGQQACNSSHATLSKSQSSNNVVESAGITDCVQVVWRN